MVCTHVLIGLLLFSLFSSGVSVEEGERVNLNILANIIQLFEARYKPSIQYAVAINVPADQCRGAIDQNFLNGEAKEVVKKALEDECVYKGQHLVAATPKWGTHKTPTVHSERTLLMCEDDEAITPVKNLLNKDNNGCVVFYTHNSPCLEFCLNQERDDNERGTGNTGAVERCILNSLSVLTNHHGPKAFVFSQVYKKDRAKRDVLAAALKKVAEKVPLYKCADSCVECLKDNQIIDDCLPEKENTVITPSY